MSICAERLAEIARYYALAAMVWGGLCGAWIWLVEDRETGWSDDILHRVGLVGMMAAAGTFLIPSSGVVDSLVAMLMVVVAQTLMFALLTILSWRTGLHGAMKRHVRDLEKPGTPIRLDVIEAQNASIRQRLTWGRHMVAAGAMVMLAALGFALYSARCGLESQSSRSRDTEADRSTPVVQSPAANDPLDPEPPSPARPGHEPNSRLLDETGSP